MCWIFGLWLLYKIINKLYKKIIIHKCMCLYNDGEEVREIDWFLLIKQ